MANIPSYMLIRQYVIDLFFRHTNPSHPLPSEHELARKFDVSRTTIRLALEELVSNGYLIRRNRSGIYLSPDYVIPTAGQYKKVLLLIGDGKYTFYAGRMLRICSKVCNYFSMREYRMLPINLSDNSSPAEELAFYRPDGILWIQPEPGFSSAIKACAEKFPLQVLFGYDVSMQNSSCLDYARSAEMLAEYFKESGTAEPYLIGAGDSPIRRPFTELWKKLYGPDRILPIMRSSRKDLSKLFERKKPNGLFCFGSEFAELKKALPRLPEQTVTDYVFAGVRHVLDLTPESEITYACRALEKLMRSPGRSQKCRLIQPVFRHKK